MPPTRSMICTKVMKSIGSVIRTLSGISITDPGCLARHFASCRGVLIIVAVLSLIADPCHAILSENLSGTMSLSGVRSESDDDSRGTLRQEYSGNWFKTISDYVTLRTSLRYYKFTFDRSEQIGLFKKEMRPTARLSWSHPIMALDLGLRRRDVEGTSPSDKLTTDTYDLTLRTRVRRYPQLMVRYDWNHLIGEPGVAGRNILDKRLDVSLNYHLSAWTTRYKYTRGDTDNRVSGLKTDQDHHLLRTSYTSTTLLDRRLRLTADYTFSYRSQTDRLPTTETLLQLVDVNSGLFGERAAATIGQLQVIPSLTDDNTTDPAQPVINVGSGASNQHLGVDFGTPRQVTALYIYTNTISDEQMGWHVYISEDNFTWDIYTLSPTIRFDANTLRYEIVFPTVLTRYLKAINTGFNQAEQVFVTEIQAVTEVPSSGYTSQHSSSHTANLGSTYNVSKRLVATADLSYSKDPSVGLRGTRDNIHHTGSLRLQQSQSVSQTVRWQTSLQSTSGEVADLRDNSIAYSFKYMPLTTFDLSLSANRRLSYSDERRESEDLRLIGQFNGTPLAGLKIFGEVGWGEGRRFLLDRTSQTWNRQVAVDARPTRSLEVTASYYHQTSEIEETVDRLLRDQYSVALRMRLTRTISMRGAVDWSRGTATYVSQEFGAGWDLSSAIVAGFLYRLSDDEDGYRSERYSVRLSCRFSGRSSAYMSYLDNDYSQASGIHTRSVQVGMRTGF